MTYILCPCKRNWLLLVKIMRICNFIAIIHFSDKLSFSLMQWSSFWNWTDRNRFIKGTYWGFIWRISPEIQDKLITISYFIFKQKYLKINISYSVHEHLRKIRLNLAILPPKNPLLEGEYSPTVTQYHGWLLHIISVFCFVF
jgi:hypothetical protein